MNNNFRIWDKEKESFYTDHFMISPSFDECRFYEQGKGYINLINEKITERFDFDYFTGYFDTNGNKIYFKDYLQLEDCIYKLIWWQDRGKIKPHYYCGKDDSRFYSWDWDEDIDGFCCQKTFKTDFVIIGNVYQNKKLLDYAIT